MKKENDIVAYWPLDDERAQILNVTLLKFQNFSHRAEVHLMKESPPMDESKLLQREALALDKDFSHWNESVTDHPSYTRMAIGSLDESTVALSECDYCHSGPVYTYTNRTSVSFTSQTIVMTNSSRLYRSNMEHLPQITRHTSRYNSTSGKAYF